MTLGARTWLERLWSGIADRGRPYADVPGIARPPLVRAELLARSLLSERGEASGAAVARELLAVLHGLNAEDRAGFRQFLATEFVPDEPVPQALGMLVAWGASLFAGALFHRHVEQRAMAWVAARRARVQGHSGSFRTR